MKIDLQHLIEEFGLDKMPEEQRNLVAGRLMEAIHTRVGLRVGAAITDEDAKRIEELQEKGDEEALHEIEKIYPDFRKAYQEEVDRIREELRAVRNKFNGSQNPGEHKDQ